MYSYQDFHSFIATTIYKDLGIKTSEFSNYYYPAYGKNFN